mgnify:CR=1 FL=1|jgi:hypothetical protein
MNMFILIFDKPTLVIYTINEHVHKSNLQKEILSEKER